MRTIIAMSGVPGTGKTVVAKIAAKKLSANLIDIKALVGKDIPYTIDKDRRTKVVGTRDVEKAVTARLVDGLNIVDGHYSHLLRADMVIVLRCAPPTLEACLKRRRWSAAKIRENVACELLDEITQEAVGVHGEKKVIEIDTTKRSPYAVAGDVVDVLVHLSTELHKKHRRIDWTERYGYLLAPMNARERA